MSLKEYNNDQIKAIKEFIKSHGEDPEKDSKKRRKIEFRWIEEGHHDEFRKKWNREHRVFSA